MINPFRPPQFRPSLRRREFLQLSAALAASSLGSRRLFGQQSIDLDRKKTQHKQVIIIGAGMSGLAAADRLVREFGLDGPREVTVVEARNRVGGRMHSDRSLGYSVEQGAAWIVGSNTNPIATLASDLGASLFTTNWDSINVHDTDGSTISTGQYNQMYSTFSKIFSEVLAYGNGLPVDQSFAQSLIDINAGAGLNALETRILELFLWWEIEADWNTTLSDLSIQQYGMGSAFAGPDRILTDGYDQIPTALAEGLDVRLDHIVEEVERVGGRVRVHTNHGTLEGDVCICTLPLGVLKQNNVLFTPALPNATQQAIQSIGFGRVFKMTLEFPSVFWNASREWFAYMATDFGEDVMFQNVSKINGGSALLMWSQNDYAELLENMSVTDATNRVMIDLKTMFGASIPDPTNVLTSGWINSPYTGGAYVFPKIGTVPADFDVFKTPVADQLYFAGEHTSSQYPGTVHGAYLSGRDVAAEVMV